MKLPRWLETARDSLRKHYPADGVAESLLWTLHKCGFDFDRDVRRDHGSTGRDDAREVSGGLEVVGGRVVAWDGVESPTDRGEL